MESNEIMHSRGLHKNSIPTAVFEVFILRNAAENI